MVGWDRTTIARLHPLHVFVVSGYTNRLRIEMLVLLAAIYTNYSSHIVDAEGIEPVDEFIAGPRAGKLILRFEEVE